MRVNADFDRRVLIGPADYAWVASPVAGVTRMMLDRVGGEIARATSLVRYEANSRFPAHQHGGGEEILVLEGAFADDHGIYPAGSYLRNPVGSAHAPRVGPDGALIFVKLHQFEAEDQRQVVIDSRTAAWLPANVPGLRLQALHEWGSESVFLLEFDAGRDLISRSFPGGAECLLLDGRLQGDDFALEAGAWLRLPAGDRTALRAGEAGARLWVKTGHLPPKQAAV